MGVHLRRLIRAGSVVGLVLLVAVPAGQASAAAAGGGRAVHRPASIGPAAAEGTAAPHTVAQAVNCANPAKAAGFPKDRAVTAVAVGMAESTCTASARASNGPTSGCPNGSVDRGMWQINSCYHSEVSDTCAFNATCNAQAAYRISSSGTNWTPWSTYNNGAYRSHLSEAQAAVDQVYGGGGGGTWPIVQQGDSGARVTTVQYLLRAHGSTVAADGAFGPGTKSAVQSFQSAHGLTADGIVGAQTWSALIVTVQNGSSGDAVRAAQTELAAHGYNVAVDGAFGPATDSAVRSFQSAHGLTADGVVGPQTWQALVS
jgi:hypothetical protein